MNCLFKGVLPFFLLCSAVTDDLKMTYFPRVTSGYSGRLSSPCLSWDLFASAKKVRGGQYFHSSYVLWERNPFIPIFLLPSSSDFSSLISGKWAREKKEMDAEEREGERGEGEREGEKEREIVFLRPPFLFPLSILLRLIQRHFPLFSLSTFT